VLVLAALTTFNRLRQALHVSEPTIP
jgi:hypothetical protein